MILQQHIWHFSAKCHRGGWVWHHAHDRNLFPSSMVINLVYSMETLHTHAIKKQDACDCYSTTFITVHFYLINLHQLK